MPAAAAVPFRSSPVSQRAHVENGNQPSRFPARTTKEQRVGRVMVRFKVRGRSGADKRTDARV
jgi:hypothetical protein